MITVLCATNRPQNVSSGIARAYVELLKEIGEEAKYLSMEDLPMDFAFNNDVYGKPSPAFHAIVEKFILPAHTLVIVAPEYNGSIPGVFKAFIDSIRPADLQGKKAALVGVSSGRGGNARGMDHLTNILHYLHIDVLPFKVPISQVELLLNGCGALKDEITKNLLRQQIEILKKVD